jgi:hypothetical protein
MSWWHTGGCAIRSSGNSRAGNLRAPHVAPVNALVDELINPAGRVRCYRHPDSDYGAAARR